MPISIIILPITEDYDVMKYMTVEEAGIKFGLSARSVRNYCAQGRFPGATLSGKTWLIPENSLKPERITRKGETNLEFVKEGEELISFIEESPVSFIAIRNIKHLVEKNGYHIIRENNPHSFHLGDKVYFIRNDTSIIALNIGKNALKSPCFHIICSHADSPCFKLKPEIDNKIDLYSRVNVDTYGGLIAPSWLDRPLSVAGRVVINLGDELKSKIVDFNDLTIMIPNVCIHFNRDINSGYNYNFAVDLQPFYSLDSDITFKEMIAKRLGVEEKDIINHDLFLYSKVNGTLWGEKKEFLSSSRLDDLECAYISAKAFAETDNEDVINVLYIADNEEIGSLSRQGADSDFLPSILKRVSEHLGFEYEVAIANSFMISADNAHGVHPNHPELTDKDNKCYLNKGIVIKFNGAQAYTSDSISSAIFQRICENVNVPYQFFANRTDMRSGSTLGRYLVSHISMLAVDVGLAQLAMHSSYETAGTLDVKYGIDAFKEFYKSNIIIDGRRFRVEK